MLHCNQMDEAFSVIQAIHMDTIDPTDFDTMKSRKDDLKKMYWPINMALRDKPPTAPNHSTFVTDPNIGNNSMSSLGPPSNHLAEQRRLREAQAQASVKHDQLLIDVQALHTSVQGADWCHAEDHIIVQGMKYRKDWRDTQNTLAKKIIEIKSLVTLNDLTDLRDTVHITQQIIHNFSSVLRPRLLRPTPIRASSPTGPPKPARSSCPPMLASSVRTSSLSETSSLRLLSTTRSPEQTG
jgi:hypothetical protein